MRMLVIEDDKETAAHLVKGMSECGYVVDRAGTGQEGLTMALSRRYDAMIVDRMLPGIDGLSIISKIRDEGRTTPVLILSALDRSTNGSWGCALAATTI